MAAAVVGSLVRIRDLHWFAAAGLEDIAWGSVEGHQTTGGIQDFLMITANRLARTTYSEDVPEVQILQYKLSKEEVWKGCRYNSLALPWHSSVFFDCKQEKDFHLWPKDETRYKTEVMFKDLYLNWTQFLLVYLLLSDKSRDINDFSPPFTFYSFKNCTTICSGSL